MLSREENDEQIDLIRANVELVAPTDADALDCFCEQWEAEEAICCSVCGATVSRAPGMRYATCDLCGRVASVTAKNLLRKARKFKAYLTLSLIRESGLHISGAGLARLTGIAGASAYNLLRKFNAAICDQMPEDAIEISARFLQLLIAKRCRTSLAELHPIAEQDLIEERMESTLEQDLGDVTAKHSNEDLPNGPDVTDVNEAMAVILNLLPDEGAGLTGDQIYDLTGISIGLIGGSLINLQLDGKIRELPGGRYVKCGGSVVEKYLASNPDLAGTIKIAAMSFVERVVEYHHRVSRRCLHWFFAPLWCELDRARWKAGSIIQLCRKHAPISYRDLLLAPSPPLIKVMLC